MYRPRQDRMDVTEINLIFLKLASDYDLSQSEFMSSRIQFPPQCDMLLSVGNYLVASNNESCHRDQKRIMFDGDHLVTTGTVTHIYQALKKKEKGLRALRLYTPALMKGTLICGITLIQ